MICIRNGLLSRIPFNLLMRSLTSLYSCRILSRSNPVSLCNLISSIAFAWISRKANRVIKPSFAVSGSLEFLINAITSSRLSKATRYPSRMWALFSASASSNFVRRTTTSWRCSTKYLTRSLRFSVNSRPFTSATLFTLNAD